MGNHTSNGSRTVILPDGSVHRFTEPVTAAELMFEHPQQVVVEFRPGKNPNPNPKPLAADMKLEENKVYMMLPMRRGKLSAEEARAVLLRANAVLSFGSTGSSYTGFIPVFVRMCPAAVVKGRKKEKVEEKKWPAVVVKSEVVVGGEGGGYYLSRQMSGKNSWKPSLDTIKEKSVKAKIRHWLL